MKNGAAEPSTPMETASREDDREPLRMHAARRVGEGTPCTLGLLGLSLLANTFLAAALLLRTNVIGESGGGVGGVEEALVPPAVCAQTTLDESHKACGGNGILFDDAELCSCFDCWVGPTCSSRLDGAACVVDAGSGTPYIFEDYWVAHPEAAVTIRPSYHIGYGATMPRLEKVIRELHALVGNAQLDGRYVVIGIGSTELVSGAMYAMGTLLATKASSSPAQLWAQRPYYSGYCFGEFWKTDLFGWAGDCGGPALNGSAADVKPGPGQRVIELVTSPNNPDGHVRQAQLTHSGADVRVVADHAYLWPHFTPITAPVAYGNDTVALFTLSKMTGHASTRIGWAVTPDKRVADALGQFVEKATLGIPRENQLRAIAVLEHVVSHRGAIFGYARQLMLSRWVRLEGIFAEGSHFRLEGRDPAAFDSFSQQMDYAHSPAYAWIERLDGGDATSAMLSVGIKGRSGLGYGTSRCHSAPTPATPPLPRP